jgi:uncharacterized protein (TIGR03435 family)
VAAFNSTWVTISVRTKREDLYDFNIRWNEAEGPTMATALQEQLGLRLESRKIHVSYFVIDSARPGPN